MNLESLREYADLQEEVLQIAQCIVDTEASDPQENAGEPLRAYRFTPELYVTEVDLSPINQGKISIHYVEDWGQGGSESRILHRTIEEFCDPKYLFKSIEDGN